MRGLNDAVADLAMAEGVFQVVRGNYDRAAGTLDAFSKGNFPPTPEIAVTPRSGTTLTHRVGAPSRGRPRPARRRQRHAPRDRVSRRSTVGSPTSCRRWLQIFAAVQYPDPATGADRRLVPSMADLGLEPIDLFYLVDAGGARDMPGFDDLLIHHADESPVAPPRARRGLPAALPARSPLRA